MIENRPYVGTWRLNNRGLVQHTPDTLVYINGDVSVPGCPRCNGRINIQEFITSVNVDASVKAGGHSANISMSVPLHHRDSLSRDGQHILRPGLEVHIYMKGYFPVEGMFDSISDDAISQFANKLGDSDTARKAIRKLPMYPYYHVFHGVVTQVDHSYSGGFQNISLNCSDMLHFWNYHNISSNASVFGARPPGKNGLKMTFFYHNFVAMSPYEIIWTLHHDSAGAAGGVSFALSRKTNSAAVSEVGGESLFSLN